MLREKCRRNVFHAVIIQRNKNFKNLHNHKFELIAREMLFLLEKIEKTEIPEMKHPIKN